MKSKYIQKSCIRKVFRALRKRGIPLLLVGAFVWSFTGEAHAVSSWNPTLLVNTESFNVIDDGDGTTDIEMRFGETVDEKLRWMINENRFEFSRDVRVAGNITATGSISSSGSLTASGNLTINSDNGAIDAAITFGNDSGAETITFKDGAGNEEFQVSDDLHVDDNLSSSGVISGESGLFTDADLTINSDDGGADATITFGNDAAAETLKFNDTSNQFELSDDLHVDDNLSATGTLSVLGASSLQGAITAGSTIDAVGSITTDANLTINEDNGDADAVLTFGNDSGAKALTYSNANTRFEFADDLHITGTLETTSNAVIGGTITLNGVAYTFPASDGVSSGWVLKTDSSGTLSWAVEAGGLSQAVADDRYVNQSGDTMTGDLIIQDSNLTATGVYATGTLSSSGTLTVEGVAQFDTTVTITEGALTDSMIVSADIKDGTITADDIGANAVQLSELDVSDVSDDIAADIAEGELADSIVVSADIKDGTIAVGDLASADFGDWTCNGTTCVLDDPGVTQATGDDRYVNTSGDTMTGDLVLQSANLITSGATITANLAASGTLSVDGASSLQGATTISSTLDTTGNITTDANLTINEDNGGADAVLTFGNDSGAETITFKDGAGNEEFQVSDDLHVDDNLSASGTISADGDITTDANLTINSDNGAANAVLTFGNDTAAETFTFNDSTNEFDLSDDINITGTMDVSSNLSASGVISAEGNITTDGNLSGSTLTVDGDVTLGGVTYTPPSNNGDNGQALTTDGAGNLSWSNSGGGTGSGGVLFLSPEYPHAVYTSSGSAYIGQMSYDYDSTNNENFYRWTSTKGTLQEYWVVARVRVPDNFSVWDANEPIEFRYRTGTANAADNYLTMRLYDTAGTEIALTGGNDLKNTSWTTATITGPQASGTYTTSSYITIAVKLTTTSAGSADAGYINLNWETTAP